MNYFRAPNGDRWWRAFGFQLGYYPHGRRPLFSERYGYRKPPPTIHLGQRAIAVCKLRKSS